MKNFLFRLLVFFLSPCIRRKNRSNAVLVVSTTGLGDTMWAHPSLQALKRAGKDVTVLTGAYGKTLFAESDTVYSISNAPLFELIPLYFTFRKKQFDTILVFHASQRAVFPFLALLKPRRLLGFSGINKGLDMFFSKRIEKKKEHEIVSRARMLHEIGVDQSGCTMRLNYIKKSHSDIVLIPGSKDPYKRWPKESFIELAKELSVTHPVRIVGNESEKSLCEEIAQASGTKALNNLSLRELINFLGNAPLVISNDTGPMHIAFATQTKTLALFSATDPDRYGPYTIKTGKVIAQRQSCTPCLRRKCAENFCMQQIAANDVAKEALNWLM